MQWIDVTNALVGANDQNIIEDKSVRDGVRVADRDEQQTEYERARRGLEVITIEQVHPLVPSVLGLDQSNTE